MSMSRTAFMAAVTVGVSTLFTAAADAQRVRDREIERQREQAQEQPTQGCAVPSADGQRQYRMNAAECAALAPVVDAVSASNWAAAQAALPAAQAAVSGGDAKYILGQMFLQTGVGVNDTRLQARGIDLLIESGSAQPSEMAALYGNQLRFALAAGDTAKAERAQAQLDALNPNDPTRFLRQARIRMQANDYAGAIARYQEAIQAQQAAGRAIPAEWRQDMAALAYRGRLPDTFRYMREWLEAAPGTSSWHDTLAVFAEQHASDAALKLDVYRLMRAANALAAERDFLEYADAANEARVIGEVAAVLQDGLSRNLITSNADYARERVAAATGRISGDRASLPQERTAALAGSDSRALLRLADAYFGYGQYPDAVTLYRAALEKGADANLVNTRVGAALALAGQRAEAEAAFRAVTGTRAELANLWLLWLSSRS